MKSVYAVLICSVLVGLASCEIEEDGIHEIELALETDYFDEIRLESSADVRIIQSDNHRVVITGRERDVYDIDVRVIDDRLTIEENGNHPSDLLIEVYVPEIAQLDCNGSSQVYGESYFIQNRNIDFKLTGSGELDFAIETDDVDVDITGSGYVYLEGDVETFDADISASGWLRSFGLTSALTDVRIEGSGSAEVNVSTDLDVFISGSGNVYYKGHPSINAQITGSGSVIDSN